MRTTSIINLKGGTGKTVTTVNLAWELAALGKRVLVIDADPQHNASTFFLGTYSPDQTTGELISNGVTDWEEFVTAVPGSERIDIIPSDMSLITADIAAIGSDGVSTYHIRELCKTLESAGAYDYVLIDCPPSFTAASVSSIVASDDVVIPIKIDAFAIGGLSELYDQINGLRAANQRIRIAGALITMWASSSVCTQGREMLNGSGVPLFNSVIRRTCTVDESTFVREALSQYNPRCTAAQDYRKFALEYIGGNENG